MRLIIVTAFLAAISGVALAQTSSPIEQALSDKLIAEINENVQLRARLVASQAQMDDLKKQLEAAKKPEAKK